MKHIVIIGNGITGITTARFVRKMSDHRITVISSESDHFYSRTALMYIYMGHMTYRDTKPYEDWFWQKNDITLLRDHVIRLNTERKQIALASGNVQSYDALVLCTGSQSNKFGWPGQELNGVQGLYGLQDLALMEHNSAGVSRSVVVGGGLIGIEMAEMLLSRNMSVTFLVREAGYMNYILPPDESNMINRHILEHGIDLRLETELDEILPDAFGRVGGVQTSKGETIPCGFVGLTAGVHPNIDLVRGSPIETGHGILVNDCFETNVDDVYAAGDCAEFRSPLSGRRPIEQLWYTGRMHGKTLAQTLCGRLTAYRPGVFFNSAKFFDIEYQTYGQIPSQTPDEVQSLYWEHDAGRKSIRINYRKSDLAVTGFNLMGIRFNHAVCAKWIRERKNIAHVLASLRDANSDPEYFSKHEREVVGRFENIISATGQSTGNR